MKTLLKPLLLSFTLSLVTLSATLADRNPGNRTSTAATFKTGIYTTAEGKLQIGLEKETGGAVDIKLKNADGKVFFTQHLSKKERAVRLRVGLLHQVLGIRRVARHAQRGRVELVDVLQRVTLEARVALLDGLGTHHPGCYRPVLRGLRPVLLRQNG